MSDEMGPYVALMPVVMNIRMCQCGSWNVVVGVINAHGNEIWPN